MIRMKKLFTCFALCLVAITVNAQSCPDNHHPHMIDLGMPSGTLWSCCNVETDHPENQSPTNYGGYYAWGETETKAICNWSTYAHCDGTKETCHDLGTDISGTEYDVAHVKWGGSWRMPMKEQCQELVDNCTYTWTTVNGVKGGMFTSKQNGNSIFLPAAGSRWGESLYSVGYFGHYWASTQGTSYSDSAYGLCFYPRDALRDDGYRYRGRPIRPVSR